MNLLSLHTVSLDIIIIIITFINNTSLDSGVCCYYYYCYIFINKFTENFGCTLYWFSCFLLTKMISHFKPFISSIIHILIQTQAREGYV